MMFAMAAVFACAPEVKPEQNGGKEDDNTGDNGGGDNTEVVVPPADASKVETYQYPIAQMLVYWPSMHIQPLRTYQF